jgi:hypothetical protein
MMERGRRRRIHFWTAVGTALLPSGCLDHETSHQQVKADVRATTLAQPSAKLETSTRAGPAPRAWGSDRLRFEASNPECAALAANTLRRLAQIRDPFASSSPDDSVGRITAFQALIIEHTACVPSIGGSWATFFEGGTDPRQWAWFVGFLPRGATPAKHAGNFVDQIDGHASHAAYTGIADLFDGATYVGPYRLQVVSDYDRDGTPEAVVWTAQIGEEIRSSARGLLWAFAGGAVAPYGKAEKLSIAPFEVTANTPPEPAPLTDLDADGRIDLLGYGPFFGVFKRSCGVNESFDAFGPRLALHALADGTFSEGDSAVVANAKRQCPARPARIIVATANQVDEPATFSNLACARLWNLSTKAINAEKKATCGDVQPSSSDCDAPRKCGTNVLAVFAAWANKPAPFTLR